MRAASICRAVERDVDVFKASVGILAVSLSTFEIVARHSLTGSRDGEDGSTSSAARTRTTRDGRAVESAIYVEESPRRVCAVRRAAFEAIEYGFLAGCGDREHGSGAVLAAATGRAIQRAVDVGERFVRAFAVLWSALEAIQHIERDKRVRTLRRHLGKGRTQRRASAATTRKQRCDGANDKTVTAKSDDCRPHSPYSLGSGKKLQSFIVFSTDSSRSILEATLLG